MGLKVASGSLTATQKAYVSFAKEIAGDKSALLVDAASADDASTAGAAEALANTAFIRLAMQVAPIDGQFLYYEFTNGGVRFNAGASLIIYDATTSTFQPFSTAPQIVSQPTI